MHAIKSAIKVNGYAYANIADDVLAKTLPHLTFLSLFSYEARGGGNFAPIIVPHAEDAAIAKAQAAGVAPWLVVSNIGVDGKFDADLVHSILNDASAADNLISNLLKAMHGKGYVGLDVDFEFIKPQDRDAYSAFLAKCAAAMHKNGYTLSVAVPAKDADNAADSFTAAYDYAAIGRIADYVTLMTYDWGYATDGAMAVAPIGNVESTVKFAASKMPPSKILMGLPNYGYDWPTKTGPQNPGRAISNADAVELARKFNQPISFDEKSQSPFFVYYDADGKRREVWFEDARSVKAKLTLVEKYGLAGVSMWTINKFWPQGWLVLGAMYDVVKI